MSVWRAVEAATDADVGEYFEGTDPLQLMAGVAAEAAPLGKAKRKAAVQGGRQVCFVTGCECTTGIVGIPTARVADAQHVMENVTGIDFGVFKKESRALPQAERLNKLCPQHLPRLPAKQIIGAKVLLLLAGAVVHGTVVGPAPVLCSAGRGARAARDLATPALWRVLGDADEAGLADIPTAEVWSLADLRTAFDADIDRPKA